MRKIKSIRISFLIGIFFSMIGGVVFADDSAVSPVIAGNISQYLTATILMQTHLANFSRKFNRYPVNAKEFLDFLSLEKGFNATQFKNLVIIQTEDGGVEYSYEDSISKQKHTGSSGPIKSYQAK